MGVYSLGDVSGGHFNPAVTGAVLVSKLDEKLDVKTAGFFALTQIVAGITAAMTYSLVHHGETFPLEPGKGYKWPQACGAEAIFTFVLCLTVLTVACSNKTANPTMFGFAIGSCVTIGGFAIGNISGGSLNPAVSIAIASKAMLYAGPSKALMYVIPQMLGGVAAAGVMMVTHADADKEAD